MSMCPERPAHTLHLTPKWSWVMVFYLPTEHEAMSLLCWYLRSPDRRLKLSKHPLDGWMAECVVQVTFTQRSLMAQMVKCLSTMWETRVQSLGWEDPLEKEMSTHSSILAWGIPWTKDSSGLQSLGL